MMRVIECNITYLWAQKIITANSILKFFYLFLHYRVAQKSKPLPNYQKNRIKTY